jgi:hypothetical protein
MGKPVFHNRELRRKDELKGKLHEDEDGQRMLHAWEGRAHNVSIGNVKDRTQIANLGEAGMM